MLNLIDDPYEQIHVAFNSIYQKELNQLIDRLKQWIADTGDSCELSGM
jgi:hypothetical protein